MFLKVFYVHSHEKILAKKLVWISLMLDTIIVVSVIAALIALLVRKLYILIVVKKRPLILLLCLILLVMGGFCTVIVFNADHKKDEPAF